MSSSKSEDCSNHWSLTYRLPQTTRFTVSTALVPDDKSRKEGMNQALRENQSTYTNSTIYRVDCSRSRRQIPKGRNEPSVEREPSEFHKQHDLPRWLLLFNTTSPERKEWSSYPNILDQPNVSNLNPIANDCWQANQFSIATCFENIYTNHEFKIFKHLCRVLKVRIAPSIDNEPIEYHRQHDLPCLLLSIQITNPERKEWSMRRETTDRRQQTARFAVPSAFVLDDKSRKEGRIHALREPIIIRASNRL